MYPASTLFVDVGVQHDLWPGGTWPLISRAEATAVAELCDLAVALDVRHGGVVCAHAPDLPMGGVPPHCRTGTTGTARVPGCPTALSPVLVPVDDSCPPLDRARGYWITSGCAAAPDAAPSARAAWDHLTAGVRDAVVFGAGIEHGIDHAVDALLRRRIRTHVVLDAAGAAEGERAQRVIAVWKQRTVDAVTVAVVTRLLTRGAN